jgi:CHAT domain-containing protein
VFVPDGPLRTIPFGALHDGERFLIETKALATTPGIALTDPRPLPGALSPLLVGLSESREGMPALPFVPDELRAIQSQHGGAVLLDEGFRVGDVRRALAEQPISVLHVATHAEFTAAGESAWLLAWDGRLSMDQLRDDVGLYRYRRQPLELLTLSACETAAGDDRAALGLSGVAVKAGARSALGTLWKVNDEATSLLVVAFYDELSRGVSRAEALRHAQQGLLEDLRFDHPGYWAPFLLIGNWL